MSATCSQMVYESGKYDIRKQKIQIGRVYNKNVAKC